MYSNWLAVDMKLFIHIHIHIHIHRFSVDIHGYIHIHRLQMRILYTCICVCTKYLQSADGFHWYTILTIATLISIPYLVR